MLPEPLRRRVIAVGLVLVVALLVVYFTVVHGTPARVVTICALSFVSTFTALTMADRG